MGIRISSGCLRAPKYCLTTQLTEFHCKVCKAVVNELVVNEDGSEVKEDNRPLKYFPCVFCGGGRWSEEDHGACEGCQLRSTEELRGTEWLVRTLKKQAERICQLEKEVEALRAVLRGV